MSTLPADLTELNSAVYLDHALERSIYYPFAGTFDTLLRRTYKKVAATWKQLHKIREQPIHNGKRVRDFLIRGLLSWEYSFAAMAFNP